MLYGCILFWFNVNKCVVSLDDLLTVPRTNLCACLVDTGDFGLAKFLKPDDLASSVLTFDFSNRHTISQHLVSVADKRILVMSCYA